MPDRNDSRTLPQCPLCTSSEARMVRIVPSGQLIAQWDEIYQIDITPEFRGVSEVEMWRCADCAVCFFAPQWLTGSPWMYEQLAKRADYYVTQKWEYDLALRDLCGRQRALEIGCGSGEFMALAKERQGLLVEGLEQNPAAIATAKERGLAVLTATVEDAAAQFPGTYDAICSFQVLEHVRRPREFLEACCALLRPGGLLALAVPNQDGFVRHLGQPLDMPPHHMTRWTRKPFRRLQSYFPLKLLHTVYEPLGSDQVGIFVQAYAGILVRRRLGFFVRPWVCSQGVSLARRFRRFLRGHSIYACYERV